MASDSRITDSPLRWVRRHVFGVRQEEFAEIAGVQRPSISRYENGRDNPSYPVLVKIRDEALRRDLPFSGDWFFAVPSAPAFGDAPPPHQIAQPDRAERAAGDNAIIGSAASDADDAAVHGDGDQGVAGSAAAGFVQLGRIEVGQSDLDPTIPAPLSQGLDTQAVAVANVDDRAGEGAPARQFGGHGASVGNPLARISQGGRSEAGEGCCDQGGEETHRSVHHETDGEVQCAPVVASEARP